jgi:aminoglycoside phosphotransferase (APT) family kinase protein
MERSALDLARSLPGGETWRSRIVTATAEGRTVMVLERKDERIYAKHFADPFEAIASRNALLRLEAFRLRHLRVPRALAFDVERGVLLMTEVEGRTLAGVEPDEACEAMRRAGAALAELHAQDPEGLGTLNLSRQIRNGLNPAASEVAKTFPETAQPLDRLLKLADSLDQQETECVPLHGDYQLRQLCDDGRSMGAVDWDLLTSGDPAYDVAYFVTYLLNHAKHTSAARGIRAFLQGYDPPPQILRRAPVYEAYNYLRRCCRRLRLRDAGWQPEARSMLNRFRASIERIDLGEEWPMAEL